METKPGRSSRVSNRSTSSSRLSRPGSTVDLLLERMGAVHANIDGVQANMGAIHADTRNSIDAIHADIGAVQENIGAVQENVGAVQANMGATHADMQANIGAEQIETREVLETVIHRLERLETSPVPTFVAGLDLNPSLSNEMTAAPNHSSISLEVKQGSPEVSTAPVVLGRSERLVNKPKVDCRQVALQPRWSIPTAASS